MERITSRRNQLCVHIKKLGASRSYREECGQFLCDGIKLLEDAAESGAEIITVITSTGIPIPLPVETKVFYAESGVIDSISPLKTAQDTLFVCKMPGYSELFSALPQPPDAENERQGEAPPGSSGGMGTYVLLDGMQDPGNVGAIIRTANALGVSAVILTDDCADPYNPKTVRATMGAIFRQRICRLDMPGLTALIENGTKMIGAVTGSDSDSKRVTDAVLRNSIIAIGSEGSGLSDEILALCDEKVSIPMAAGCESLNAAVAAAIIIWEAQRG